MSPKNPGVGETHTKRMEELDPIQKDSIFGINYEIYIIERGGKKSHFTCYIKHENICSHLILNKSIPHPPAHESISYGPTEDNWFGFGTIHEHDYNYTSELVSFQEDCRSEILYGRSSIEKWTPERLESELKKWILKVKITLEGKRCQICGTQK